jgi:hypothetical protein
MNDLWLFVTSILRCTCLVSGRERRQAVTENSLADVFLCNANSVIGCEGWPAFSHPRFQINLIDTILDK